MKSLLIFNREPYDNTDVTWNGLGELRYPLPCIKSPINAAMIPLNKSRCDR